MGVLIYYALRRKQSTSAGISFEFTQEVDSGQCANPNRLHNAIFNVCVCDKGNTFWQGTMIRLASLASAHPGGYSYISRIAVLGWGTNHQPKKYSIKIDPKNNFLVQHTPKIIKNLCFIDYGEIM